MKWHRNVMKRLDATDDPRPMSVSLRPQNGQLTRKDEKRRGKTGGEKSFSRDKHKVFFLTHKNTTRNMKRFFVVKWMEYRSFFVLGKFNNKLGIRNKSFNKKNKHKQKVFWCNRREMLCSPICSRRRERFFVLKMDNRYEKIK